MSSARKIDFKSVLLIVFFDAVFYILALFMFKFWSQRIQLKMAALSLPSDLASIGQERLQALVREVQSFYLLLIISFVLVLVAIIFLAGILKGIIWAKTTNTKLSLALISKFIALNLIWMSFWFALVFAIAYYALQQAAPLLMGIALLLAFYLTNSLYTIFMKKQKISAILDALKISTAKVHLFLLPYALMILLFIVIFKLTSLIEFKYAQAVAALILIAYAALIRYYSSTLTMKIQLK